MARRISLPKDALTQVDLGDAFAENDLLSRDPSLFVKTPASVAALKDRSPQVAVGRGKGGLSWIPPQVRNIIAMRG